MQSIKNILRDEMNIFMLIVFLGFTFDFVTTSSLLDQILDGLILAVTMVYFRIRGIL
ncbi:hypothetical protein OKW21_003457 [Catalinimonas alkaloidigena]|uniref:hypothetical protein n=1 Tax=Catalinimonas alkaloidigena TaxID=1075417 RepID=UPI0024057A85|nr:hypothetical protein [Catalinimonas alkaloidigena]MDF9798194.1 hypothetical protein [Catalinimonas alkaloidigena]